MDHLSVEKLNKKLRNKLQERTLNIIKKTNQFRDDIEINHRIKQLKTCTEILTINGYNICLMPIFSNYNDDPIKVQYHGKYNTYTDDAKWFLKNNSNHALVGCYRYRNGKIDEPMYLSFLKH